MEYPTKPTLSDENVIEIKEHLRVQGVRKKGDKYVRIIIPAKIAGDNDILPGDLLGDISIGEHIKVGRKK